MEPTEQDSIGLALDVALHATPFSEGQSNLWHYRLTFQYGRAVGIDGKSYLPLICPGLQTIAPGPYELVPLQRCARRPVLERQSLIRPRRARSMWRVRAEFCPYTRAICVVHRAHVDLQRSVAVPHAYSTRLHQDCSRHHTLIRYSSGCASDGLVSSSLARMC